MTEGIPTNALGWPIYIISLPRETARRAACKAMMEKLQLPFAFFDAVDGANLSGEEMAAAYDPRKKFRSFKRCLSTPEIGCYLSHHSLWKRIGESKYSAAVVLEDDFEAEEALPSLLDDLGRLDLTNLLVKLHSEKPATGNLIEELSGGYRLIAPYSVPGHTLGYVVSREAATKLADKALTFSRPVDIDIKHWWDFDISILMVQPSLLHIRRDGG